MPPGTRHSARSRCAHPEGMIHLREVVGDRETAVERRDLLLRLADEL
jgi:hypothetical protein